MTALQDCWCQMQNCWISQHSILWQCMWPGSCPHPTILTMLSCNRSQTTIELLTHYFTAQHLPTHLHTITSFCTAVVPALVNTPNYCPAGLAEPEPGTGGFDKESKRFVVQCLRRLERTCRWGPGKHQLGVQSGRLVAHARVPVLKLQLDCGTELDVSLNDDGGIKAARFLQSFVSRGPCCVHVVDCRAG
jgi:hypothetical protein